jgi:uncharacterized OB-fold protein
VTWLVPQSGDIPVPVPSVATVPFWEGCRVGELRYLRCEACGAASAAPALLCSACAGRDLAWAVSSGRGSVLSWTVVWRPQTPAFTTPYVPIVVELDEGWQLLSNLVGCEHDAVHVGLAVEVALHPVAGGAAVLPYFQPAGGTLEVVADLTRPPTHRGA